MVSSTVGVAVVGIVVSGVVGPAVMAWAARRANRAQFERDQGSLRRADLRALVDQAAELLGAGATNLRLEFEARAGGRQPPPEVREWSSAVFLLQQRLLLRLPPDHQVITDYDAVRTALVGVGAAGGGSAALDAAILRFEATRAQFLDRARMALSAPIEEGE